jgi:UDP-N-acetylmuramyl tripeptide synthase
MINANNLAVVTGKLTAQAIRLAGLGLGSNLPGRLARKLSPQLLRELAGQAKSGIVGVTGTNGKSTTAGLIASIMRTAGLEIVHNYQGANLITGITACLVEASNWSGEINADYCLFECDEAAFPLIAAEADIQTVVVTNLFRDQLDRFGELDATAALIERGIKKRNSKAILNADDPNVSRLGQDSQRLYFGVDSVVSNKGQNSDEQSIRLSNAELAYCSICNHEVAYEQIFYGQLGKWFCPVCDNKRPAPQIFASQICLLPAESKFKLHLDAKECEIHLPIPGLFNIYNALAAAAYAHEIGISMEAIRHGLKRYETLFGRSEKLTIEGKKVIIQLIKNPAGTSQALSTVVTNRESTILIAINDNLADGRDISWLWDADFELLQCLDGEITVAGTRAEDMAVRIKYAGYAEERINSMTDLEKALDAALNLTKTEQTLWILPTYTALLSLQKILKRRGLTLSKT